MKLLEIEQVKRAKELFSHYYHGTNQSVRRILNSEPIQISVELLKVSAGVGKKLERVGLGSERIFRYIGYATPLYVATGGMVLGLLEAAIGINATTRIPFTEANIAIGGSLGNREISRRGLANYLDGETGEGKTRYLVDMRFDTPIAVARGTEVFRIGELETAPPFDLNINYIAKGGQKFNLLGFN